jgi:hypothetical protein
MNAYLPRFGQADEIASLVEDLSGDEPWPEHRVHAFVPKGSDWRWAGASEAPGDGWRAADADDSGWASGTAPLGYGESEIETEIPKEHLAIYLRKAFDVADPTAFEGLKFRLRRDDGAAVFLNGICVFHHHLPPPRGDGRPGSVPFAEATVGDVAEHVHFVELATPDLLVAGKNVVAVQVHQANAGSSDLFFDLAVEGLRAETAAAARP